MDEKLRVLVCGGRNYSDARRVNIELNLLNGADGRIAELAQGQASGADRLARAWAIYLGVPSRDFPPDWRRHGKAAGPIRNQQMLDEFKPDLVVAFPGGRGTAHMVRIARAAGVEVREVQP